MLKPTLTSLVASLLLLFFFWSHPYAMSLNIRQLARPFVTGDISQQAIKCVLTDFDGTLLTSKHSIRERSFRAIGSLKKFNIQFFPATGRTRQGMVNVGGKQLVDLLGGEVNKIPGVFNQGLVVYGENGKLIHENYLNSQALEVSEAYCEKHGLSVIGYYRDRIVTNRITPLTEASSQGKEPLPELVENGLLGYHQAGSKLNKIMILATDDEIQSRRPELEKLLHEGAHITQAVPGMLEILPFGSSKGGGVQKLLDHFKINPQNCIAFGDGENDLEMISLVQYGIAMSNAREKLLARAFRHTLSNDEDGVAFVLENVFRDRVAS